MANSTADSMADSIADHPVGMAYSLGGWETDHRATATDGRWGDCRPISSIFDVSLATGSSATEVSSGYGPLHAHVIPCWSISLGHTLRCCTPAMVGSKRAAMPKNRMRCAAIESSTCFIF